MEYTCKYHVDNSYAIERILFRNCQIHCTTLQNFLFRNRQIISYSNLYPLHLRFPTDALTTHCILFDNAQVTYSGYIPERTCDALEKYIDKTKLELTSMSINRFRDNLTKTEREAFVSLNNNPRIVIKKADKSNTVVVMDRDQYISEGIRQLNSTYYVEVQKLYIRASSLEFMRCFKIKLWTRKLIGF